MKELTNKDYQDFSGNSGKLTRYDEAKKIFPKIFQLKGENLSGHTSTEKISPQCKL